MSNSSVFVEVVGWAIRKHFVDNTITVEDTVSGSYTFLTEDSGVLYRFADDLLTDGIEDGKAVYE